MVSPPRQLDSAIERSNSLLDNSNGVDETISVSMSGFADRQGNVTNQRPATQVRNMVRWLVPESGLIEMYINPKNIRYNYKKDISQQRTKGGYSLQYWGEQMTPLSISGTTGSSGIEGINVLYDVYRAEQLAYDPYALALAAQKDNQNNAPQNELGQILGSFADLLQNTQSQGVPTITSKPTLASLAFSVEMYWSGWVFRGFFNNFTLEESADKVGLFDYSMEFIATQRRGFRENFLGWHRSATSGPSDSSWYGVPYTFKGLEEGFTAPGVGGTQSPPNLSGTGTTQGINRVFGSIIGS